MVLQIDPLGVDIAAFLAIEAQKAGVRRFRSMKPSEKPKITHPKQTGCGQAKFSSKEVLIDTDQRRCVNLHNFMHEIAHIGVLRKNCKGHGDIFYWYNYALAQRMETAIPRSKRWRTTPTKAVLRRAAEYRSFDERCRGGKPFPG
ncbi:hypothetical protein [Shimia sp. Alg240-R146]|uniref:hypothetical protein n=1 Tax=Shimia sp. Alg240-R146 TaxID=2993449 RepID=UPI0022DFB4DA|nr:hypothetical protein [Shimia sp. Alg240-R146]